MITRLMTLFFNLLFELYLLVHFVSAFEDLQDSCNPHFALSFGLWDTHLCPSIALLALSGLWGGGEGGWLWAVTKVESSVRARASPSEIYLAGKLQ